MFVAVVWATVPVSEWGVDDLVCDESSEGEEKGMVEEEGREGDMPLRSECSWAE